MYVVSPSQISYADFIDRMPVPIGDFISANVYKQRLSSQHEIKSMDCVAFIDVANGNETKSGFSWTVRILAVQCRSNLKRSTESG
jgi:hypothetical protein